jgi:hypothetical protein
MVCPPATSEAGARWPRFGLVVATTTSRRDNKDQMIRPVVILNPGPPAVNHSVAGLNARSPRNPQL